MKKRTIVAVVLAVLMTALGYAQATDFFALVKSGSPQDVQAAIDNGANVNARDKYGATPLMAVVEDPLVNLEVMSVLLKAGAEVETRDSNGLTALMRGARSNIANAHIDRLLKAGADIEAKDNNGVTALLVAAESNPNLPSNSVLSRLIKACADFKARDKNGNTALILAIRNPDPDVITAFLKAGADAKAKNNRGYSALDYAKVKSSLEGTEAFKQLEEASKQAGGCFYIDPQMESEASK
jgi:uncharacterized protein